MLMVAGTTFICETVVYLIQIVLFSIPIDILPFLKIILVEILYNLILTILLYTLIQKMGNNLEATFMKKSILTKYY